MALAVPLKALTFTLIEKEISPRPANWRVARSAVTSTTISPGVVTLPFNPVAIGDPRAHAITVAGVGVSGVGIALLHGPVGMENEHVVGKRRLGNFHKPRPNDWERVVFAAGNLAAGRRAKAQGDHAESCQRPSHIN